MQQEPSEELRRLYNCSADELSGHIARYRRLIERFPESFAGKRPTHVVRAPGRVNLIGEHTDYNGYPVLPMAIDRDFLLVLAPQTDASVELANENPAFEHRTFKAEFPTPPFRQGDWGNYAKAAVHGILEAGWIDPKKAVGFKALIGGTIPESAGLSSSSALVVASALAFLTANNYQVDKLGLAELLSKAERYVGSEGGGMDQAVSLLAESGNALKIDFFPLRIQSAHVPATISFIVCNSLIRAPKSENVRYEYNRRVIECRLATALIVNNVQKSTGKQIQAARLADLAATKMGVDEATAERLAEEAIGRKPLKLTDIAQRLGEPIENVQKRLCMLRDGSVLPEPRDGFKVWNRYRHVVTEAMRVNQAVKAFNDGELQAVGELMNQSHSSCRDDYEISCPELEELVSIARRHGAVGSRLTGAGFGGCTVNAVPTDQVARFTKGVAAEYYGGYIKMERSRPFIQYTNLGDVLFLCRATTGASVWPTEGRF